MDEILRAHRLDENENRRPIEAPARELPDGVFLLVNAEPWLSLGGMD